MNETLQIALAEIIMRATNATETAIEFMGEQLPDVVNQLLMWKFTMYFIQFLVGFFLIIVALWIVKKMVTMPEKLTDEYHTRYKENFFYDKDGYCTPTIIPGALFTAISAVLGICSLNLTWLQIWIAPKIYLIEYAASLVAK